jgi:hypothetical protein
LTVFFKIAFIEGKIEIELEGEHDFDVPHDSSYGGLRRDDYPPQSSKVSTPSRQSQNCLHIVLL